MIPSFSSQRSNELRAFGVPGGEVTQSAAAFVFVLDALAALDVGRGRQRGVLAAPRLDRGLLVTADGYIAAGR